MLNHVILVGKLVDINKTEDNKASYITLAVPRSFKNADGEYEKDLIECICYGDIAEKTAEYCKSGDTMGIKGRIQQGVVADNDGNIVAKSNDIIAEKVTFLSSKSNEINKEVNNE
jgi:single-strand DNA-binding protein